MATPRAPALWKVVLVALLVWPLQLPSHVQGLVFGELVLATLGKQCLGLLEVNVVINLIVNVWGLSGPFMAAGAAPGAAWGAWATSTSIAGAAGPAWPPFWSLLEEIAATTSAMGSCKSVGVIDLASTSSYPVQVGPLLGLSSFSPRCAATSALRAPQGSVWPKPWPNPSHSWGFSPWQTACPRTLSTSSGRTQSCRGIHCQHCVSTSQWELKWAATPSQDLCK